MGRPSPVKARRLPADQSPTSRYGEKSGLTGWNRRVYNAPMNTQTDNQTKTYKGGLLDRIQAQWVADWLKSNGVQLSAGWTSIWRMNAKKVAAKYGVNVDDVTRAANGEMR